MNGEVCCILGVCCPPEARAAALAKEMVKDRMFPNTTAGKRQALRLAKWQFKHFDMVPAGTGVPLMQAAAAHAKQKP